MAEQLKYAGRIYDSREIETLKQAADEFWLTHGHFCDEFEDKLAKYLKIPHVILTNSGSSACLLAFMALTSRKLGEARIKRGDEIITTACCFPTTLAPIIQYGAIPVFVDITIPSYNINVKKLKQALTSKTKAIVLAHTLGNPFNIDTITQFCRDNSLYLIEDCSDALGGTYNGRKLGTYGTISTLSFYPAHQITTGEGGALATEDKRIASIITSFRDWGRDCHCKPGEDNACGCRFTGQHGLLPKGYDHKYVYSEIGYNLKMTDLQGAIGTVQMDKVDSFVYARRRNWTILRRNLAGLEDILCLPEPELKGNPSWFGFMITIKNPYLVNRRELQEFLEAEGIQTRLLFAGNIIRQPCFDGLQEGTDYRQIGKLVNTDKAMNDGLWVGVYPGLSEDNMQYIGSKIHDFINRC